MTLFVSKREKLIKAWQHAEKDLGISVQTPFILKEHSDSVFADILVEEFGSKKGTVILTIDDMNDFNIPEKYGYYCSALHPSSYNKYDRESFIETLNDWGYYGDDSNKPDWYTGEPWTEK